jgi:hypothetical protein
MQPSEQTIVFCVHSLNVVSSKNAQDEKKHTTHHNALTNTTQHNALTNTTKHNTTQHNTQNLLDDKFSTTFIECVGDGFPLRLTCLRSNIEMIAIAFETMSILGRSLIQSNGHYYPK